MLSTWMPCNQALSRSTLLWVEDNFFFLLGLNTTITVTPYFFLWVNFSQLAFKKKKKRHQWHASCHWFCLHTLGISSTRAFPPWCPYECIAMNLTHLVRQDAITSSTVALWRVTRERRKLEKSANEPYFKKHNTPHEYLTACLLDEPQPQTRRKKTHNNNTLCAKSKNHVYYPAAAGDWRVHVSTLYRSDKRKKKKY